MHLILTAFDICTINGKCHRRVRLQNLSFLLAWWWQHAHHTLCSALCAPQQQQQKASEEEADRAEHRARLFGSFVCVCVFYREAKNYAISFRFFNSINYRKWCKSITILCAHPLSFVCNRNSHDLLCLPSQKNSSKFTLHWCDVRKSVQKKISNLWNK